MSLEKIQREIESGLSAMRMSMGLRSYSREYPVIIAALLCLATVFIIGAVIFGSVK